jgi:hypothetical protein
VWLRDSLDKGLWTYFYSIKNLKHPEAYVCTEEGPIPVLPEADYIEEVDSITEDEDWSENEMYSAEVPRSVSKSVNIALFIPSLDSGTCC